VQNVQRDENPGATSMPFFAESPLAAGEERRSIVNQRVDDESILTGAADRVSSCSMRAPKPTNARFPAPLAIIE
jgi:hypothetical protein